MFRLKLNLERLSDYPLVSIDTETTGLHWTKDEVFGIAVAAKDGNNMYRGYYDIREHPQVVMALAGEIPKCKKIVNHNIKFDAHFLRKLGVALPLDRIECTSVRAALINEHEPSFSLDSLGKKYLGQGKTEGVYEQLAALFGGAPTREAQMKNLHRAPERVAAEYAIADPELAIMLWLWQEKEIEDQHLQMVWGLERDVTPTLIEIEEHGVRVDEERAYREWKAIDGRVEVVQKKLDKLAGRPINANSAPQMRGLFGVKKVDHGNYVEWHTDSGFKLQVTDGGEASLGKDSLELMANLGDERAKCVMQLRKQLKAKTFLKDHIIGHAVNGRVYPNYNQTRGENELGTGTGRFSINDPALQQIPARDVDVAAIVRSCFLPEKGEDWGCADWEQFEFRWFAHYTQDPAILKAYDDDPDTDYHQIVSEITGIPRNATHAGAANAKQINLGLVFGMGEGEMAFQMGLDYTSRRDDRGREWKNAGSKAKAVFSSYHGAIPGVRQLLDKASSIARARGFVKTAMGRHIRFPGGKFTHKAAGLVFQGTSADCMKVKMVSLHKMAKKMGFRYLLSVHDEHDTSIPKKGRKEILHEMKKELELFDGKGCPVECRVPIRSSIKVGPTWWDACKKD